MKGIVIENDNYLPHELEGFLKDQSTLFSEVNVQLSISGKPLEHLTPFILEADAIIIESHFINKKQLTSFTDAFVNGPWNKKQYKFYINNALEFFNAWLDPLISYSFISNIKYLVSKGGAYGFEPDWTSDKKEWVTDCFLPIARSKEPIERPLYKPHLITYNIIKNKFEYATGK